MVHKAHWHQVSTLQVLFVSQAFKHHSHAALTHVQAALEGLLAHLRCADQGLDCLCDPGSCFAQAVQLIDEREARRLQPCSVQAVRI